MNDMCVGIGIETRRTGNLTERDQYFETRKVIMERKVSGNNQIKYEMRQ